MSPLHQIRATQQAFAAVAEVAMRDNDVLRAGSKPLAGLLATAEALTSRLQQSAVGEVPLALACGATGLLLAFQPLAQTRHVLWAPLCELYAGTLEALSQWGAQSPRVQAWLAAAAGDTVAVTAGVACSCLLTSMWSSVCEARNEVSNGVEALVAAAFVRTHCSEGLHAPGSQSGAWPELQAPLGHHAHAVTSALSAVAQGASGWRQLDVCMAALLQVAARAATAGSNAPAPCEDDAACTQRTASLIAPLLWQVLMGARALVRDSGAGLPGPGGAGSSAATAAPSAYQERLGQVSADALLACSLVHDSNSSTSVPQLRALLACAQAALPRTPAAAALLTQRIPRPVPQLSSARLDDISISTTGHSGSLRGDQARAHGAGVETSLHPSVYGRQVAVRFCATRWSACASFLLVMAAPSLASTTHPAGDAAVGAAAGAAEPALVGLAAASDAAERAAAADFALGIVDAAPADAQWAQVLVLRWLHAVAEACAIEEGSSELLGAMRGLVASRLRPRTLLACCQQLADQAQQLLAHAADSNSTEKGLQGVVGALMIVVVWGDVSMLEGVLALVQRIWLSAGVYSGHVAGEVMQHLLHCHDHRKKPRCVRWYSVLRSRSSSL